MLKAFRTAVGISVICILISVLSCASSESTSSSSGKITGGSESREKILEISKPYSIITFRKSLVQFHEILNSYDYFNQFTWGDYIFEDYLTTIYGLENSEFDENEGTEISVYDNNGKIREKVKRSVIEKNGKGETWWQTEHSKEGSGVIFYEVKTNRFSVPVSVRFRNNETGEAFSRDTMFGESVRDAMLSMSDEEIQAKLDEERGEEAVNKLMPVYENLKNIGIETIEAGGRKIEAVHYQGTVPNSEGDRILDVWYTPEISQGIVRIIMNRTVVAEITEWVYDAERAITEDSPHELPAYSTGGNETVSEAVNIYSEGTVSAPVKLDINEVWEGSVEPEGVSYYFIEVPENGDVICNISGFSGLAELYNYGNDYSFSEWITGSEGGELDFQVYAAEKGDLIYFSVNDINDSYSDGERFFIDITVNPLLDPMGIKLLGRYKDNPAVLEKGKNRIRISGPDPEYFVYEMEESGDAVLLIEDIDSLIEKFYFIDTEKSSYSSSSYSEKDDYSELKITGLEKGEKLYFYIVRKDNLKNKKINIIIR